MLVILCSNVLSFDVIKNDDDAHCMKCLDLNSAQLEVRSIVINPSVCLSVCSSVCLSASISLEPLDRSSRNYVYSSPVMAVARSSSGGAAIPGRSLMSMNALILLGRVVCDILTLGVLCYNTRSNEGECHSSCRVWSSSEGHHRSQTKTLQDVTATQTKTRKLMYHVSIENTITVLCIHLITKNQVETKYFFMGWPWLDLDLGGPRNFKFCAILN